MEAKEVHNKDILKLGKLLSNNAMKEEEPDRYADQIEDNLDA